MIGRVLIAGGAGDLTGRYLLPALADLHEAGRLDPGLGVVGLGRHEWDDHTYRDWAAARLGEHRPALGAGVRDALLRRLTWRRGDATDPQRMRQLLHESDRPAVVYLALPPAVYAPAVDALRQAAPVEGSRLVVEKPFGTDLDSARDLNRRIAGVLPERAVFRVDHFLAMQTVQNLLGLRFGNRLFEPVWNQVHVQRVDIVFEETLGLEGRAGFYDQTGALRDMLQNHLLQLLALVAMEPPAGMTEADLRDRKADVLRATGVPDPARSIRARYTAGEAGGRDLPDYTDEAGVDPARGTETFAEVSFAVDNWRWAGVPFVLRSGKALGADRTELVLQFRPVPHTPFARVPRPNVLRIGLGPDRIGLGVNLNGGGGPSDLEPAELTLDLVPPDLPAYARLLLDILDGDPTLAIRADEAEQSWRIVEPVLAAWRAGQVPLRTYPAGSGGPKRHRS